MKDTSPGSTTLGFLQHTIRLLKGGRKPHLTKSHPMPQSLHQVYGHIVFSTKNREPLIHGNIEKRLYEYIGGIIRDLKATPILINGMPDHVHLLIASSKHVSDIDFIRQVKSSSSKWMSEQGEKDFRWQAGYGWFGVSAKDLSIAKQYVAGQKEHHRKLTFQDEFKKFLTKYRIPFDEKYVWD